MAAGVREVDQRERGAAESRGRGDAGGTVEDQVRFLPAREAGARREAAALHEAGERVQRLRLFFQRGGPGLRRHAAVATGRAIYLFTASSSRGVVDACRWPRTAASLPSTAMSTAAVVVVVAAVTAVYRRPAAAPSR